MVQTILGAAAKAMGSLQRLADSLGVPRPDLAAWIAGDKPPPDGRVFLALVLVGDQSSRKDHDDPVP